MRIVVCAKEVLDSDAVNNYALAGHLEIGEDGKSLTQSSIPRLMNAYDEQAIEAALRFKDAADCRISVVSVGPGSADILKHAAAMGADEISEIPVDGEIDHHVVAAMLAAYIRTSGGADLILCGRQASDDDQGVVPALIGEVLDIPVIPVARSLEVSDGVVRVTRVTPDGDEVVEASCPAVVTISNEFGEPRYPTTAAKMNVRKMKPATIDVASLGLDAAALTPRVVMTKQFVPMVQGNCEFIEADDPAAVAITLVERLRADGVIG